MQILKSLITVLLVFSFNISFAREDAPRDYCPVNVKKVGKECPQGCFYSGGDEKKCYRLEKWSILPARPSFNGKNWDYVCPPSFYSADYKDAPTCFASQFYSLPAKLEEKGRLSCPATYTLVKTQAWCVKVNVYIVDTKRQVGRNKVTKPEEVAKLKETKDDINAILLIPSVDEDQKSKLKELLAEVEEKISSAKEAKPKVKGLRNTLIDAR